MKSAKELFIKNYRKSYTSFLEFDRNTPIIKYRSGGEEKKKN